MDKQTLQETVSQILDEMRERPIPLGVSSRHIHLSSADYLRLFPEQPISEKKPLMQPGQYAAEQVVTLLNRLLRWRDQKANCTTFACWGRYAMQARWKFPGRTPER